MKLETLTLPDGSVVEYCLGGQPDADDLLVFHIGTPNAATEFPELTSAAARNRLRTVTYSRPGYGTSTRQPGRRVADQAPLTALLADHLGYDSFVTAGWSGGGSAALACAALLGDRVRACLVLAGLSPPHEVGPEWFEWVPEGDADEFRTLDTDDRDRLIPAFEEAAAPFAELTPESLASLPGTPQVDREALLRPGGFGPALTEGIRRGVGGIFGWFDDSVAAAGPWGFQVGEIEVPVVIRHGELDPLVDVRHGRWLGAHIPGAITQILPDAGHGSIADPLDVVVEILLEAAR
jgi:pimeloyl-ACP methyl ester carboxylesterase